MDALQFSGLLSAAAQRREIAPADLSLLAEKFSFAPAVHILHLLSTSRDEPAWKNLLHQTAARTLSRSRLHYLLEGVPELEAQWIVPEPVQRPESVPEVLEPEVPVAEIHEEVLSVEEQPNDFGFSFVRLKAGKKTKAREPEEASLPVTSSTGKKKSSQIQQDALIEKFLTEKPFLQPRIDFGDKAKVPDLSKKSSKLKEEIVTENMAMIYIRQKKFPQAIATLHKLTLKIPEKSAYFAALIKNLESQNPS